MRICYCGVMKMNLFMFYPGGVTRFFYATFMTGMQGTSRRVNAG